ncbi:MAG: flagellar biosynthetic protein FliO [Myxococcota bacterium]
MRNPRRIAATPSVTFWIVLASGMVCGAAVAATPDRGVEPVPEVAAPETEVAAPETDIPEVPEAPPTGIEDIPAVPAAPEPEAAPREEPRTARDVRREERGAPAAPAGRQQRAEAEPGTREAKPGTREAEPGTREAKPAAKGTERVPAPQPLVLRDGPVDEASPREEGEPKQGFATLVAMVALLVAAGAVFVHLRSRKGSGGEDDAERLEVLSSVRLAGKWPVSLVRVPGRVLVVGATDKGVTLLAELEPDGRTPVAEAPPAPEEDDVPFFDLASRLDAEDDVPPTYRRPRRSSPATRAYAERPATRPSTRGRRQVQEEEKDEAFLDHLLDRLADAKPAVIRQASPEPEDERDALRQRVKTWRRGPTRL